MLVPAGVAGERKLIKLAAPVLFARYCRPTSPMAALPAASVVDVSVTAPAIALVAPTGAC
jgi:hypothetical protein